LFLLGLTETPAPAQGLLPSLQSLQNAQLAAASCAGNTSIERLLQNPAFAGQALSLSSALGLQQQLQAAAQQQQQQAAQQQAAQQHAQQQAAQVAAQQVQQQAHHRPSMNSAQKKKLQETDALEYLNVVRTRFVNKPEAYSNFLEIMKEFKSQVIDTSTVINKVAQIFAGHHDLIVGFNTFLPPEHQQHNEPRLKAGKKAGGAGRGSGARKESSKNKAEQQGFEAYHYVSKIKARFESKKEVGRPAHETLNPKPVRARARRRGWAVGLLARVLHALHR